MRNTNVQYYTIICDKKKKKKFMELLGSYGATGIETIYGRGSAKAGAFAKALGFEPEEHKVILSSLLTKQKAIELTAVLRAEYGFDHSNTGIGFGIPVEGLAF